VAKVRSKIVLIRGWGPISPEITLGEYERINADYVVLITALRYPPTLPDEFSGFEADPNEMLSNVESILGYWAEFDQQHLVAAEYASTITGRHRHEIKAVEGTSLRVDWFYDTVRNYHRFFNQHIIDTEVIWTEGHKRLIIEGETLLLEEAIQRLKPRPYLG
tara:strand:+ start:172 stop:657 length:486 start_codon:yes stop_codon:yes gene_type:complete